MAIRDGKREWKPYQAGYKALLMGMIGRDSNPALYRRVAGMQPEIKQVVIEEWQAVDRCTTCHLGIEDPLFAGATQPFTTHPYPQLLKQHPVEKFGCTICHGGQGRSTTYRGAAHRTIAHWPDPMVEKGLIQSRCGICHKEFEAIGADKLIEGRQLFKEMHCAGCHQIERVGGDVGPVLSAFADKDPGNFSYANVDGVRSKQNWVREHFKNPQKITPDSPMRPYPMSERQIECLASYVLSLSQRVFPRSFTPKAGGEPSRVATATEKATASSKAKGENP
jgi:mono/diheme cytochrome c family protein